MTSQGRNRLTGSILFLVSILWCWGVVATIPDVGSGPVGPRGFPLGLGILLAVLSALLFASSFVVEEAPAPADTLKEDGPPLGLEIWAVLSALAMLIGYALLLYGVGFLVGTVVMVAAGLMLVLGKRDWRLVGGLSVGTALGVFVIFNKILGVYLPHGQWIDIWF